jgi:hypothetical protein
MNWANRYLLKEAIGPLDVGKLVARLRQVNSGKKQQILDLLLRGKAREFGYKLKDPLARSRGADTTFVNRTGSEMSLKPPRMLTGDEVLGVEYGSHHRPPSIMGTLARRATQPLEQAGFKVI